MAAENDSNGMWRGDIEGCSSILSLLSCPDKRLRPRKYKGSWFSLLYIYDVNKNFATSLTSNSPSQLLPAMQKSSLLLDTISKSFYYTNLVRKLYFYIIDLNGLTNYKNTGELAL